jgi:hypothetical protein
VGRGPWTEAAGVALPGVAARYRRSRATSPTRMLAAAVIETQSRWRI